jgi:hypothetical protein
MDVRLWRASLSRPDQRINSGQARQPTSVVHDQHRLARPPVRSGPALEPGPALGQGKRLSDLDRQLAFVDQLGQPGQLRAVGGYDKETPGDPDQRLKGC